MPMPSASARSRRWDGLGLFGAARVSFLLAAWARIGAGWIDSREIRGRQRASAWYHSRQEQVKDALTRPEGFGGWLLLIAIGQWLGVFAGLGQLLLGLPDYMSQGSDPLMRRGVMGEAGLEVALLAMMLYTAVMMSMKRREFPALFRIQLALIVVVPLLSTWWTSTSAGKPIEGLEFAGTAVQAVVGVIGASLSILYSLRSERVRNTFSH